MVNAFKTISRLRKLLCCRDSLEGKTVSLPRGNSGQIRGKGELGSVRGATALLNKIATKSHILLREFLIYSLTLIILISFTRIWGVEEESSSKLEGKGQSSPSTKVNPQKGTEKEEMKKISYIGWGGKPENRRAFLFKDQLLYPVEKGDMLQDKWGYRFIVEEISEDTVIVASKKGDHRTKIGLGKAEISDKCRFGRVFRKKISEKGGAEIGKEVTESSPPGLFEESGPSPMGRSFA